MRRPHSDSLDRFTAPKVVDAPIARFDNHGLGQEPNNLAAIGSLTGYRTLRWGCNVELILTDQRSYRSEEPTELEEAKALSNEDFPEMIPQQAMEILDSAREYNNGNPPLTIRSVDGSVEIPNVWKARPPQTVLGAEQKVWFLERLKSSKATWKIWGNTTATLDMRADPQNLPEGITRRWPWLGYAGFGGGDHSTAYIERGEIYDFVLRNGITGFATVAGDRHSFWAGLAAKALPPSPFSPVGVAFVTGSISAPGMVEALEHSFPKNHRLRALYLGQGPNDQQPQATVNMLLRHGVRSCLEYAKTGDIERESAQSNQELSPHVKFVDMGGHGYSVVTATTKALETEFVCVPRPLERSERADGGPLRYRIRSRTALWKKGEAPKLEVEILEGDPKIRSLIAKYVGRTSVSLASKGRQSLKTLKG